MDMEAIQGLLGDAIETDAAAGTLPEPPAAGSSPDATPQSPSGVDEGSAGSAESFTPINPDTLPEELQPLAKQLQGAFTRKTQELAELRKAYEAFGDTDPRQVLESYQFVQALQTDPRVAMQVHQELSQVLQAQGFTPAQAAQGAADLMGQQQQGFQQQDEFDMSWMDEPAYTGVNPEVQRQLNEMQMFMQNFQQQQEQAQFIAEVQRQEFAIRQNHPEYQDSDIDRIYQLASWHGDMNRAEQEYATMRDEWAANFLNQKSSVPANTPQSSGPAQTPQEGFKTLSDPNLDAAVREHLANIGEL